MTAISPCVGARDFRTDDRLEQLDTNYSQILLRLDTTAAVPIQLPVSCEKLPRDEP